ncbi:MAG TPA: CPBP family intramembrane glutamic endopeptidase [Gemmatimonadaceae bacterium]|nr:CPBP family intramembrane glutamic endopeptidase [Gemmatimonadaceae bacterium]
MEGATPELSTLRSYWDASRAPRYSILFALPLLVLYEVLAAVLAARHPTGSFRNAADVVLQWTFISLLGRHGPIVLAALLFGVGLWLVLRDMRAHGGGLRPRVFGAMFVESTVLALAFGTVVGLVTATLLGRVPIFLAAQAGAGIESLDWWTRVMLSLGAGLYEELLFRVVLVSALFVLARRAFGWRPRTAGIAAVLVGATLFSAFHYIGPYGDPLQLESFVFRLVAGVFFSGIYLLRGFGITAWTHALYDLFLLAI